MFDWSHAESRTALLVIALGAPEYMIFFAWSQNHAARYLDREAGVENVPFVSRMLNAFRGHPRTEAISSSEVRTSCTSFSLDVTLTFNPALQAWPFSHKVDLDT